MEGSRTSWAPSINIMEGGDGHHDPSLGPASDMELGCFGFILFMGAIVSISLLLINWLNDEGGSKILNMLTFIIWFGAAIFYWRSWFKG